MSNYVSKNFVRVLHNIKYGLSKDDYNLVTHKGLNRNTIAHKQ